MMIRVPLVGTGALGDHYRVPLPTWRMVAFDVALGQAIVEIPDDDIAQLITSLNPTITAVAPYGNVVTALAPADRLTVLAAIRAKYRERAGTYTFAPQ